MVPAPWTRRRFLWGAGAISASAAAGLYTWRVEPHWLEIVRRPLPIRGLPTSLHGRTLVQLSDIHVGPRVDDDYVLRTFREVAELAPDLVVITGDFVSHHPAVFEQAAAVYRAMPRGRLATVGILGNHDGNRQLYVSRGVGHLLHVRFNVRPEVTVFTLTPA